MSVRPRPLQPTAASRSHGGWKVVAVILIVLDAALLLTALIIGGLSIFTRAYARSGFEPATATSCRLAEGQQLVSLQLTRRAGTDFASIKQVGLGERKEADRVAAFAAGTPLDPDVLNGVAPGRPDFAVEDPVLLIAELPSGHDDLRIVWSAGEPLYEQYFPVAESSGDCE